MLNTQSLLKLQTGLLLVYNKVFEKFGENNAQLVHLKSYFENLNEICEFIDITTEELKKKNNEYFDSVQSKLKNIFESSINFYNQIVNLMTDNTTFAYYWHIVWSHYVDIVKRIGSVGFHSNQGFEQSNKSYFNKIEAIYMKNCKNGSKSFQLLSALYQNIFIQFLQAIKILKKKKDFKMEIDNNFEFNEASLKNCKSELTKYQIDKLEYINLNKRLRDIKRNFKNTPKNYKKDLTNEGPLLFNCSEDILKIFL
jgi:hypothetical protein